MRAVPVYRLPVLRRQYRYPQVPSSLRATPTVFVVKPVTNNVPYYVMNPQPPTNPSSYVLNAQAPAIPSSYVLNAQAPAIPSSHVLNAPTQRVNDQLCLTNNTKYVVETQPDFVDAGYRAQSPQYVMDAHQPSHTMTSQPPTSNYLPTTIYEPIRQARRSQAVYAPIGSLPDITITRAGYGEPPPTYGQPLANQLNISASIRSINTATTDPYRIEASLLGVPSDAASAPPSVIEEKIYFKH